MYIACTDQALCIAHHHDTEGFILIAAFGIAQHIVQSNIYINTRHGLEMRLGR